MFNASLNLLKLHTLNDQLPLAPEHQVAREAHLGPHMGVLLDRPEAAVAARASLDTARYEGLNQGKC